MGDAGSVTVDGGEIDDHLWIRPADAIQRRLDQEIELIPPTWITLKQICGYGTVQEAFSSIAAAVPELWVTRLFAKSEPKILLWEPDAAYHHNDLAAAGPRNRLVLHSSPQEWIYERS